MLAGGKTNLYTYGGSYEEVSRPGASTTAGGRNSIKSRAY